MKRALTVFAVILTTMLASSVAMADALVHVKVRGTQSEGRVTLTPAGGGQTYSCETTDQECRIDAVPGGRYRVTFQPESGAAARPTHAMIPPTGTVTLFVSAGSRR